MTYDFSIPRHVDYFRDEVDRAWKFYESQILIRANELQDRARSKGFYAGGPITIGYIVDKNPKSPTYMKYIPYPRHAERSLELFQWLYDCGGILGVVYKRLDELTYVWPLEEDWVKDQKAFWTNLEVVYSTELDEAGNLRPLGYRISAHALAWLLGNRVYRGDWPYDGDWIEHNHEAIVPEYLFDFAQEVLERNRQAKASGTTNYHTQTTSVIHDILYPGPPGVRKRFLVAQRKEARYRLIEQRGMRYAILSTISIRDVEQVFLQKFTEYLRDTKRFENYEEKVDRSEETKKIEGRRKNLLETIAQLSERIEGIFLTLQSPSLKPEERDDFIKERRKLIERREKVQNELHIKSPAQVYMQYKDLIEKMGKYWERYPYEDRQALVALLVRRVYLEPLSHHFMKMTIEWKEFPSDVGIMWRRHADSLHWEENEDEILYRMYPTQPPDAIQQVLRRRTWAGIQARASDLHIKRIKKPAGVTYKHMSLEDLQIAAEYGILEENFGETLFTQWVCPFRGSRESRSL
jgi:hypothetical protein